MKKSYKVTVERTSIYTAEVEVEAEDIDEAARIAKHESQNQVDGLDNSLSQIDWDLESEEVEVIGTDDPEEDSEDEE